MLDVNGNIKTNGDLQCSRLQVGSGTYVKGFWIVDVTGITTWANDGQGFYIQQVSVNFSSVTGMPSTINTTTQKLSFSYCNLTDLFRDLTVVYTHNSTAVVLNFFTKDTSMINTTTLVSEGAPSGRLHIHMF